MRRGIRYTHPRFMDVSFVVLKAGFYGGRWKVSIAWFVRDLDLRVQTKHEFTREKALEFTYAD